MKKNKNKQVGNYVRYWNKLRMDKLFINFYLTECEWILVSEENESLDIKTFIK